MIKLICVDVDGTILNSKREVLDSTVKAVKEAKKNGIRVVINTGRNLDSVIPFAQKMGMEDEYIILNTGASILKLDTMEEIYKRKVDSNLAKELHRTAKHYGVNVVGYTERNLYMYDNTPNYEATLEADILEMDFIDCGDDDFIEFSSVSLVGPKENINRFIEDGHDKKFDDFFKVRNVPIIYEFLNKEAGKGRTMLELGKILGIEKDEIMVIGDGPNDLDMFASAGVSVAMGNARDIVKENADIVTLSNDEGGVAEVIYRAIENRI